MTIVNLSTISQSLDRLNLDITNSVQSKAHALIVCTLAVGKRSNRVTCIRSIIEHTCALQVIVTEETTLLVIDRNQWISTQHVRDGIAILITYLDTLILLVAIIYIFTYLNNVKSLTVAINYML